MNDNLPSGTYLVWHHTELAFFYAGWSQTLKLWTAASKVASVIQGRKYEYPSESRHAIWSVPDDEKRLADDFAKNCLAGSYDKVVTSMHNLSIQMKLAKHNTAPIKPVEKIRFLNRTQTV